MFLFRNRLAIGAIIALCFGALKVAFDLVYKILKILKLQLLLAVLFVGAILFITKVLPENQTLMILFFIFLAMGFFYAVIGNLNRIKKFFKQFQRERKYNESPQQFYAKRREEKYSRVEQDKKDDFQEENQETVQTPQYVTPPKVKEKYPKYYKVKQNNNYVMAEYKDRYELYVKKDGKLFKVRTDVKKENL